MTVLIFDARRGVPQQCYGTLDDAGLCGEMLADDVNQCPVCGYFVAWKSSKTWAEKFGKWQVFTKRILSTPRDQMGLDLLKAVGANEHNGQPITAFAVPHDLDRWRKISEKMSRGEVREILVKASRRKTKDKSGRVVELRGYALLNYVLNACEKSIREKPSVVKQASAFEGLPG